MTAVPAPRTDPAEPDARRYVGLPDGFSMWRGGTLRGARLAYETWGRLNRARDNAILLFTGLSPPPMRPPPPKIPATAGGSA
ncbi:hypothetical protein B2A_00691 [mine drainage metagenome]|uniref:Uncharacterized protein n=1 Tax=mine drainage metagenome TaxID=410659 RepID=T1BGA9_9ZZZZ